MSILVGWAAIALSLFALAPSFVPGAMSLIGLALSVVALVLSLLSIKKQGKRYFTVTAIVVLAGMLLINDTLRLWAPMPTSIDVKIGLYGVILLIVAACFLAARKLAP